MVLLYHPGGLPYETDGMLVVSLRGVNFGFLVLLKASRAKPQYSKSQRSLLGLHAKNIFSIFGIFLGPQKA